MFRAQSERSTIRLKDFSRNLILYLTSRNKLLRFRGSVHQTATQLIVLQTMDWHYHLLISSVGNSAEYRVEGALKFSSWAINWSIQFSKKLFHCAHLMGSTQSSFSTERVDFMVIKINFSLVQADFDWDVNYLLSFRGILNALHWIAYKCQTGTRLILQNWAKLVVLNTNYMLQRSFDNFQQ